MKRRDFLRQLGIGSALFFSPMGTQFAFGAPPQGQVNSKKLLLIFQRGACDGLSVLPPIEDDIYYNLRPSISIAKNLALPLSGPFGMHPALKPLEAAWKEKDLFFIHQFGSPNKSRSHFDAQDYMELGTPGLKSGSEGLFSRALILKEGKGKNTLRAVALQSTLPRILQGEANAVSMRSLKDFQGGKNPSAILGFESLYEGAVDRVFRGVGEETFSSIRRVGEKAKIGKFSFPKGELPRKLSEIADLFTSDLGVELAVTEVGGWDTHAGQGSAEGSLSKRLAELAAGLESFRAAMIAEKQWKDTLVLVITEFGRTAKENGTRGTDHGHGSVAFVLGGEVGAKQAGGRVIHSWKSLKAENLYEERDVPVVFDFRDLLAEALHSQMGLKPAQLAKLFPGHTPKLRLSI